jgi:hypothetical protein
MQFIEKIQPIWCAAERSIALIQRQTFTDVISKFIRNSDARIEIRTPAGAVSKYIFCRMSIKLRAQKPRVSPSRIYEDFSARSGLAVIERSAGFANTLNITTV